ncbi:MAG: TonB-dependent receptor plug domain-containing protein [Bacteroidales bacterium]|nr:TonB-dependent receptor plug domain-containing protein [Bacteroidales bacterium]
MLKTFRLSYIVKCCLTTVFLSLGAMLFGQNITVSGHLYERGSLESLPGGLIYEPVSQKATTTNTYGFYTLTLPYRDGMFVVFNCFGFVNDTLWVKGPQDVEYDARLSKITTLETVTITGEKTNTEQVQMSSIKLSTKEIQQVPMLFGEKDVFKTLLLLPGVQSASEGTSGIYVRGGGPDQNLIILDEATIYNASHLLGFFSIFNGDAIKSVELIKGGFPARYGGRLSSVIDINMKDGNKDSYHVEGGVGIISSNVMVEGPIIKDKASFMISGRTTYLDLLMLPLMKIMNNGTSTGYYFFDLNGKLNFELSKKDKLYLSAYFGRDKFHVAQNDSYMGTTDRYRMGLFWQNATATARWNHLFTNKIFSNLSFVFSDYTMNTYMKYKYYYAPNDPDNETYSSDFNSGIRDYTLKYDIAYHPNATHHLLAGAAVTYHEARPNAMTMKADSLTLKQIDKERGLEYAVYVEDEINIRNKFRINPGVRLVAFSVPHKTWFSPEPRLAMSYNFLSNLALKASYAMMSQNMILLSTSTIGLPTDLWVPVTDKVRPQRSQQVALGLHYDLKNPQLSFSVEGYYKWMNNILAYKEGTSYFTTLVEQILEENFEGEAQSRWAENVTSGKGWSYGVEFLVRKEVGKFTGWVGYTLSWTKQQFDELNFGEPFFARYDRRHDVSIVLMYSPTKKINLSLSWVFATGNAVTLPTSVYTSETLDDYLDNTLPDNGNPITYYGYVENYGKKNDFRMKPFHHLDIGVQFIKPHTKNNGQSIFEISIYNVYNHHNPFFYYTDQVYGKYKLQQISIFPIIPTFTYHFKF